jgi:IclR family transcriptional regulator, acetate operon repressor
MVLELVAASPHGLTIRELVGKTHLNPTTTYHIVNTLRRAGYLQRDTSHVVRLGPSVARLYQQYESLGSLEFGLMRLVEDLAETTGETAYITESQRGGVSIRAVFEGTKSLRVGGLIVGYVGNEFRRASGKAVLAYLDEDERRLLLEQRLADAPSAERQTILSRLDDQLALVREQGIALDSGEYEVGICCAAVPFFGKDGRVKGAITLSAPEVRAHMLFGEYAALVRIAAARATALCGGTTGSLRAANST